MEKKHNRGFSLLETLIVSTFISGVLIILFTQYIVIQKSYDKTYNYNGVISIYQTKEIVDYLSKEEASFVIQKLGNTPSGYFDITDCSALTNKTYCQKLFELLNVKTVIISLNDLSGLKTSLNTSNIYSENLFDFINYVDTKTNKKYRVVVEYQNGAMGSLNLGI